MKKSNQIQTRHHPDTIQAPHGILMIPYGTLIYSNHILSNVGHLELDDKGWNQDGIRMELFGNFVELTIYLQ